MSYESWGTFHIITLFCPIVLVLLLYFSLKNKSLKFQKIIIFSLSLIGVICMFIDMFYRIELLWYNLPFHLCTLNGFVIPFVALTQNKRLGNSILLWSFGALGALIFNLSETDLYTYNLDLWLYFLPHLIEVSLPITMILLKIVKFDYKTIPTTLLITFIAYTTAHILNYIYNTYYIGEIGILSNFMFSYTHENNPFLLIFYSICQYPYFYMLLLLPVIIIFLLILYLPQIIKDIKFKI